MTGERKSLSISMAVKAKCADCMHNFVDGRRDCEVPSCPLYPWMRYGHAWKNRAKRTISEEHRSKTVAALARFRASRSSSNSTQDMTD